MVGRTVSHYRVLALLGSGGMGTVYQAEDTRLKRRVALKCLPAGLARDRQALERFQREARAASALNHPHICTIYDIDEAPSTGAGQAGPFIAMELLEGQTLKARLQGRQLPTTEIVDLGLQLADGLEAAHAKGIVHRDVKPAKPALNPPGGVPCRSDRFRSSFLPACCFWRRPLGPGRKNRAAPSGEPSGTAQGSSCAARRSRP